MTTRYVLLRAMLGFLRSAGKALRHASLPAFFGRLIGNTAELRATLARVTSQADDYRALYEQEREYSRKLMDRLLERQGSRAVDTPPLVAQARPPAPIISQDDWVQQDESEELEQEAMIAASDPERLALAKEAALENPAWARVASRAEQILRESSSQPAYGESSEWPT